MKEIILYRGIIVKVSDEDFEYLTQGKWSFDGRYAYRKIYLPNVDGKQKYKKIYMQKEVNKTPDGMDTDHINCDKLDNRRENLRSTTRGQNNANMPKMRKECTSKFKGVFWDSRLKKWRSSIKYNSIPIHLGVFDKEEDAADAYNAKALELFGEFSRLNNIN